MCYNMKLKYCGAAKINQKCNLYIYTNSLLNKSDIYEFIIKSFVIVDVPSNNIISSCQKRRSNRNFNFSNGKYFLNSVIVAVISVMTPVNWTVTTALSVDLMTFQKAITTKGTT